MNKAIPCPFIEDCELWIYNVAVFPTSNTWQLGKSYYFENLYLVQWYLGVSVLNLYFLPCTMPNTSWATPLQKHLQFLIKMKTYVVVWMVLNSVNVCVDVRETVHKRNIAHMWFPQQWRSATINILNIVKMSWCTYVYRYTKLYVEKEFFNYSSCKRIQDKHVQKSYGKTEISNYIQVSENIL